MSAKEIFELRKQGRTEDAYEAARLLYAADKGPYASTAMFWTAVDMLRQHVASGQIDVAQKILLALQRLLPNVPDKEGWASDALEKCKQQVAKAYEKSQALEDKSVHTQMGIWGEEVATVYLRSKGYIILERDWHSGHRDIDIVARNNEYVVFVEVKTRKNRDFGDPVLAVNYQKRKNLRRAINHYIHYKHIDIPYRFDIITVVGSLNSQHPEITHLEGINIIELYRRR